MEDKLLQFFKEGGMASIALASLYINWKIVTNHMEHSNNALNRLENAIIELTTWLKSKKK